MSKPNLASRSQIIALVLTALSLGACEENPLVHQDDPGTQRKYEKKAQAWVRWALEQPWSTGPVLDTDGSACAQGQSGKTWFLAGTSGGAVERECTIPADKQLFFPLVNRWVAVRPELITEEDTVEAWAEFAMGFFDDNRARTCGLTLRIDGHDLLPDLEAMDEELYVRVEDDFQIEVLDDNFASSFGLVAGPRTTWTDGHYAWLRELPPGDHTLEIGGRICNGEDTQFETAVTYTLHVEE